MKLPTKRKIKQSDSILTPKVDNLSPEYFEALKTSANRLITDLFKLVSLLKKIEYKNNEI